MAKLGFGLIGCGWVGEEYIKACLHDGRAEVRALCGRTREKPEAYKAKYNLDCAIETDYARLVARDDIDVVAVCTPGGLHTGPVIAAAEAGKHILIEKPVAMTMDEVRQQQAAVAKAGVKTVVSFVLTWNPLLVTIDNLIRTNALGHVFLVEVDYFHRLWFGPGSPWEGHWMATREHGGSSFLTAGCHAAAAMRWFARSEAVEVSAYNAQTENPAAYPGTTAAVVRFADGTIGRTTSCFDAQMPYVFHIGVYGTEGSVRNDRVYAPKVFPGQNGFVQVPCVLPDSGDVAHHPFRNEMTYFIDCILGDKQPYPDLDDAAKTMAVCFAADRSAAEGRPVRIAEV